MQGSNTIKIARSSRIYMRDDHALAYALDDHTLVCVLDDHALACVLDHAPVGVGHAYDRRLAALR